MSTATVLTGGRRGPQIIGALNLAAGALASVNPALLPPSWLPYFMVISGLATVFFKPPNAAPPPTPVPQP